MLVTIGRKPALSDLVELLLECHGRIRGFVALAETIGQEPAGTAAETIDGCARCMRYFTEALPLHVEDEEVSLLPRLHGLRPELDLVLATMERQHSEHEPVLQALLGALAAVRGAPDNPLLRPRLAEVAAELRREFEAHLAAEETVIFPAVRALPPATQADILTELRMRRERTMQARSR